MIISHRHILSKIIKIITKIIIDSKHFGDDVTKITRREL